MKIGFSNIRRNAANTKTNYDIIYSAKKPSVRSIFVFKIIVVENEATATFAVKPKFLNIDQYRQVAQACPDAVKNVLTNIKICTACSATCVQQVKYTLDGTAYNACTYGGDVFANLTADEWQSVKGLIAEEFKAHTEQSNT
ncbi:MAG: hypothetical protein FWC71_06200 [Defluviitaleaceae bacterium]|nr:hypothetical protein [Defluviitaleaceae bacterium]